MLATLSSEHDNAGPHVSGRWTQRRSHSLLCMISELEGCTGKRSWPDEGTIPTDYNQRKTTLQTASVRHTIWTLDLPNAKQMDAAPLWILKVVIMWIYKTRQWVLYLLLCCLPRPNVYLFWKMCTEIPILTKGVHSLPPESNTVQCTVLFYTVYTSLYMCHQLSTCPWWAVMCNGEVWTVWIYGVDNNNVTLKFHCAIC
jgi:hypothetical protein